MNTCRSVRYVLAGLTAALAALAVSCRTPAPAPRATGTPTRIALVSDIHVQQSTNEEKRLYPVRFAKTIEAVNAAQVDLVLIAGDLTEHGSPSELAEFRQKIKGFKAPVWFVPGNHDLGNKRMKGKKDETNFARNRAFELEMGRSFFVRKHAGVRVIGINSCIFGSGLPREKQMWEFLEEQLAKPSPLPTVLLQHHPPFLKSVDEAGGDYFNMEPYPRARLLALARQAEAKIILSGHLHRGLTNYYGRLPLLTTPPVSFSLAKGKQREGWTLLSISKKEATWQFQPLSP